MAARRAGVGVVHLEAGLRSFNERSMEESNRRMVAALATLHLAPTEMAADFLRREGVPDERIRVVGNPVLDAIVATGVRRRAARRAVAACCSLPTGPPTSTTRSGWPSWPRSCAGWRTGPAACCSRCTRAPATGCEAAGLWEELSALPGAQLVDPLPYAAMLRALAACAVAVTDSGGLQEEASYLGVPVVVMRSTTPRWEGVETGAAVLCGLDADRVLAAVDRLTDAGRAGPRRCAALPLRRRAHRRPRRRGPGRRRTCATLLTPRDPELGRTRTSRRPASAAGHDRPAVRGVCVDLDDTLFPQQEWLAGAWAAVADRAATLGLDGAALHRPCSRASPPRAPTAAASSTGRWSRSAYHPGRTSPRSFPRSAGTRRPA